MFMTFKEQDEGRDRRATNYKNNLPLAVAGTYDFVLIGKTEELGTSLLLNREERPPRQ